MLPPSVQQLARRQPATLALPLEHGRFRLLRNRQDVRLEAGAAPLPVTLAVGPDMILVRRLNLPRLSRSDTMQLIRLDLDRHTPFTADQVYLDVQLLPGDGSQQLVDVAVMPRARADRLVGTSESAGLAPRALSYYDEQGALRFDLLPAVRSASPQGMDDARRWWLVAGLLLLLNLGTLAGADMLRNDRLREQVESQSATVKAALGLRSRIDAEQQRRALLVKRRNDNDPLPLIDQVSRLLPPSIWVQRFNWNGETLELSGHAGDGSDAAALLQRNPAFRRAAPAETTLAEGGAGRFEIVIPLHPGRKKP